MEQWASYHPDLVRPGQQFRMSRGGRCVGQGAEHRLGLASSGVAPRPSADRYTVTCEAGQAAASTAATGASAICPRQGPALIRVSATVLEAVRGAAAN